jgi:hypothetical protein
VKEGMICSFSFDYLRIKKKIIKKIDKVLQSKKQLVSLQPLKKSELRHNSTELCKNK